jgi:hypothetical protein
MMYFKIWLTIMAIMNLAGAGVGGIVVLIMWAEQKGILP